MKGFLFLDINKPVQNSIFVFIIVILIYLVFFQKRMENKTKDKKYILPVLVVVSAIIIFYVFKMVQIHFS